MKEIRRGQSGKPFIIHIQDAHSNLSGQQNLANTLDNIMSKYGVSLVLVEGGASDGTLTQIRKIVPREACQRTAKRLLMQGRIAGEEYLNLTNDQPMTILGVENLLLYAQSLKSYGALAGKREEILQYLSSITRAIEKLKARTYPKELLNYEKQKQNEKGGESNFSRLIHLAHLQSIDLKEFPGVQKLSALQEREKKIDFNAANLEQAVLCVEISQKGGKIDQRQYLKKASGAKNSKSSQFAYFQNTFKIAIQNNIPLEKYPNLMLYRDYLEAFLALDLDQILEELSKVEDKVYVSWLESKSTRTIRSIDRYVGLLSTAYRIQMSTRDYELFQANEPDFATVSYLAFINKELTEYGYFDLVPYQNLLEEGKKALLSFYESVSRRDLAFVDNAAKAMEAQKQKAAVLITGGYHTSHLKQLVLQKGYSWAVLTPKITAETDQGKYEKLLLAPLGQTALSSDMQAKTSKYDGVRVATAMY
ncbi:MAG: hypothetical protein WCG06_06685, partial [Candidatus Omnitrophota bacterium]